MLTVEGKFEFSTEWKKCYYIDAPCKEENKHILALTEGVTIFLHLKRSHLTERTLADSFMVLCDSAGR